MQQFVYSRNSCYQVLKFINDCTNTDSRLLAKISVFYLKHCKVDQSTPYQQQLQLVIMGLKYGWVENTHVTQLL